MYCGEMSTKMALKINGSKINKRTGEMRENNLLQ